jgi:hypothetical protein
MAGHSHPKNGVTSLCLGPSGSRPDSRFKTWVPSAMPGDAQSTSSRFTDLRCGTATLTILEKEMLRKIKTTALEIGAASRDNDRTGEVP